jgi:hypothetical protein
MSMRGQSIANPAGRSAVPDGLFLVGVTALSAVPYLTGLGFYSDDYAFLATMTQTEPQTFRALLQSLLESPNLAPRPVQAAYLAMLYKAFGLSSLPGHVVNHVVFATGILFFYAALRRLGLPRFTSVALPLIFASLPHYATDRFWLATYQITLSMALFFVAFYASARFAEVPEFERWPWLLLASAAMLVSLMAYETFTPLFLLVPAIVWLPRALSFGPQPRLDLRRHPRQWPFLVHFCLFGAIALAVFLIKVEIYGEQRLWHGDAEHWIGAMTWLIKGVLKATFLDQGVRLPVNVATLLRDQWRPEAVLIALVGFAAISGYLFALRRRSFQPWRRWQNLALGGLGVLIFFGGYAVFANNFRIGFSPTGLANRVSMAAGVGVATIALSCAFLVESLLPGRWKRWCAPLTVSIGCSLGVLINGTPGVLWTEAAQVQRSVLAQLRAHVPELPAHTTLLLDGVCPFVGPGPVFESSWDLRGALQILYDDPSLQADVIKPNVRIGETAITTTLYDTLQRRYPYGRLLVYNVRQGKTWRLTDRQAAIAYFSEFDPAESAGCAFEDGGGVRVY